jgi:curli biogenesis system outer membrane secretion channel CsgG
VEKLEKTMSRLTLRAVAFAVLWCAAAIASGANADDVETADVAARPPAGPGLRKVVAVARFENRTNADGQAALNNAMADQLTDALIRSNQFTVVERQTVEDVLGEQDFANSGRVMKKQTARTGRVIAAQVLIKGTITEYEGQASKSMRGVTLGIFKLGKKGSEAHVGLMIRLIDATTSEVMDSQRVVGTSKGSGIGFQVGFYGEDKSQKAPMAKATQDAIDQAVNLIAKRLASVPFEARIIKTSESELLIRAGKMVGAEVGDQFAVYSLGEELIDPYTGESLGREEERIGVVRVTQVKQKYSKAVPVGNLGPAKPGDLIRELK